jgi:hypothetical protein
MAFQPISRRTMLRGLGTAVALPFLDAMAPSTVSAALSTAAGAAAPPVRMAMFFLPNGMNVKQFFPTEAGADYTLSPTLEPLAEHKNDLLVLSNLALDGARAQGDGGGDHARSAAAFLTGAHPRKTAGADIHNGVSVDQLAATKIGGATRLPSLELGLDRGQTAGECDSGYSCAYVTNISWRSPEAPMPHETNPAAVFERLFGSADELANAQNRARRLAQRKSILDYVAADSRSLSSKLGRGDQQKLDEFTTSIREVEKQVEKTQLSMAKPMNPGVARPDGVPDDFKAYMRLMCDMMVLAFRMDITRVSTCMVARDGSERTFRWLGLSDGHHTLSHHGSNPEKLEALAKIDRFHVEQFAYLLGKMKSVKEGERTLLDNSMIMFGAGISDGNRHNHNHLPILLAGRGGGTITPGRHVQYATSTPLCNLYLSMLDRMGVKQDRFSDSTGMLTNLTV